MEEIREPNYGNLKEALGAANAANITSALLSSELFDDFMDMVGNDREIAKTFVKLMSSLMDKSCYAEMLSVLAILCAVAERDYPEELKAVVDSPLDLKALMGEMVSDFEDILAQEYE